MGNVYTSYIAYTVASIHTYVLHMLKLIIQGDTNQA